MSLGVASNANKCSYVAQMFNNGTPVVPIGYSIALVTGTISGGLGALPGPADTAASITEPLYTSYARGGLNPMPNGSTWTTPIQSGANAGRVSNAIPIQCGSSNTNGTAHCVGWAIIDSAGVLQWYGALDTPIDVAANAPPPVISIGAISIQTDK